MWQVDEKRSLRWNEPPSQAEADAIVEALVLRQKCDAIFTVNDLYAARIAAALRRMGRRVPDDVALIGADNMDISTLIDPQITTIDVQIDDLARATVNMLFEMLSDGPTVATKSDAASRGVTVKPKLVVRQSA